jgi:hypothetical protein
MSDLGKREIAKDAGRPVSWWLVTYLFYALGYFFSFVTAFPTAASPADHILVYLVNLAIFSLAAIFIFSIFLFRKFFIILSCFLMFLWVAYVFANVTLNLPSNYRIGGDASMKTYWGFFFTVFAPAFVFLGLTMFRIINWNKRKAGD